MEAVAFWTKKLFFEKTGETSIQFFRYLFVGGMATVVDMGTLYVFTSILGLNYLISAAVGFVLGVTTNYLMCIAWVFKSTGKIEKEIVLFVIIGIGGLVLNEVVIWLLVEEAGLYYMMAKAIAVAVVMVWNFGMRKKFVFAK